MARGEKSANASVKPARARRIAEATTRQGATRPSSIRVTGAAGASHHVRRDRSRPARADDLQALDPITGAPKTRLSTRRGVAQTVARKPATPTHSTRSKRKANANGGNGKAAAARTGVHRAPAAARSPVPRKRAGAKSATKRRASGKKSSAAPRAPRSRRRRAQGAKRNGA